MPRSIGFVHDSTELRRLIAENPDLPIVVACDDEQCIGEGISTYMNEISCSVCEVLDAELRNNDYGFYEIFDNREDAEETIEISSLTSSMKKVLLFQMKNLKACCQRKSKNMNHTGKK